MPAGTALASQGPVQKRLMEGSRLAQISRTAVGETRQISRQARTPRVPRTSACAGAEHVVRGGWLGRAERWVKHLGPRRKEDAERSNGSH